MSGEMRLFLAGDVMTGRGIDQALPHPGDPVLHEPYVTDARQYLALAEEASGPIASPLGFADIWGEALAELEQRRPHARIVNLETSITTADEYWPGKGIHYCMHPDNVPCLTAAAIDCCTLANNHVLDWGFDGLVDTVEYLRRAGIATAGAGRNRKEAVRPAILPVGGGRRILVTAVGAGTSGIPDNWNAGERRPGVHRVDMLSQAAVDDIGRSLANYRRPEDVSILSVHWGGNWGYAIGESHRRFARWLIDRAGVDVVFGHSSHHPLPMEWYRGRPILYGCGDLINDYEGIGGHESYRPRLGLMVFVTLAAGRGASEVCLVPMERHRFRLRRPSPEDVSWLWETLDRQCRPLNSGVDAKKDGSLTLVGRD